MSNEDFSRYMVIDACMLLKRTKPDAKKLPGICLLPGPGRHETLHSGYAIKWDPGYLLPYNEGFTKKAGEKPARQSSEVRLRDRLHPNDNGDRIAIHQLHTALG